MSKNLITINNCRIDNTKETIVPSVTWTFEPGQAWLIIGPNGGGKADFINALSQNTSINFVPNASNQEQSLFSSVFSKSVEVVSLEVAAKLIQEERENDESDYVEGGVDIGRTGRVFIAEGVSGTIKKNAPLPDFVKQLDTDPSIKLCGVENILDRGLKYMSTGEIRRTLLARALISGKQLLILSDPFAGLDVQSRTILLDFFNSIANRQISNQEGNFPKIILGMERWHEIPDAITHVLEFKNKQVEFCGTRSDYEKLLEKRTAQNNQSKEEKQKAFSSAFAQTLKETEVAKSMKTQQEEQGGRFSNSSNSTLSDSSAQQSVDNSELQSNQANQGGRFSKEILVQMNNVNVGWGDHKVLRNLNWTLFQNEHWLVRGPNGSGKTTFLELITGDNQQVYCNDIHMFGIKRGTGETIWDIKKNLGIVSYRMHVEYRMLGGTSLQNVIVSGFRDSIGLYGGATDVEADAAKKWLTLGGFQSRENENFGNLSYGEQRAILILRSAVKSPKILILDEPCHGLDENNRDQILQLIQLIAEQGTTTILHVTHDPSEVLPCEKHILELHPNQDPMYQIITKE